MTRQAPPQPARKGRLGGLLAALLIAFLIALSPGGAGMALAGGGPPPVPPAVPEALPAARGVDWGMRLDRRDDFPDVQLGVGYLLFASQPLESGGDWVRGVLLPLWKSPDGPFAGWLARGWWVPVDGEAVPVTTAAMVETGYAVASFVVLEVGEAGWFQMQWSVEGTAAFRVGWGHADHLEMGDEPLLLESWEELFRREVRLAFRQESVPHVLRGAPRADATAVARIGAAHQLELLETSGDWMRVRVFQPPKMCLAPGTWQGEEHTGWIRWRSAEKGPWVWHFTRGC